MFNNKKIKFVIVITFMEFLFSDTSRFEEPWKVYPSDLPGSVDLEASKVGSTSLLTLPGSKNPGRSTLQTFQGRQTWKHQK